MNRNTMQIGLSYMVLLSFR